jgi:hypothetical protein
MGRYRVEKITEHRHGGAALAASEARYRALVRVLSSLVWATAADGQIVDMPEWRALTGQAVDEAGGRVWLGGLHPNDHDRSQIAWQTAARSTKRSIAFGDGMGWGICAASGTRRCRVRS